MVTKIKFQYILKGSFVELYVKLQHKIVLIIIIIFFVIISYRDYDLKNKGQTDYGIFFNINICHNVMRFYLRKVWIFYDFTLRISLYHY